MCRVGTVVAACALLAVDAERAEVFPLLHKHSQQLQEKHAGHHHRHHHHHKEEQGQRQALISQEQNASEHMKHVNRLPAVATVMSSANKTLEKVNSEVAKLEAQVLKTEQQDQAKLAAKKAEYEKKLAAQDKANQKVNATNTNITAAIASLQQSNAAARKQAVAQEAQNALMRKELKDIQVKLSGVNQFMAASLKVTDDHHAKELAIMNPQAPAPKKTLAHVPVAAAAKAAGDEDGDSDSDDDDSDDDSSDDDVNATSLLAMGSTRVEMEDKGFVQRHSVVDSASAGIFGIIGRELQDLSVRERQGEQELNRAFQKAFQAGSKKHQQLLTRQKQLKASRTSLLSLQKALKVANAHLDSTAKHLQQRLKSAGEYLQQLARLTLTPAKEAQGLIEKMPNQVPLS